MWSVSEGSDGDIGTVGVGGLEVGDGRSAQVRTLESSPGGLGEGGTVGYRHFPRQRGVNGSGLMR